MAFQGIFRKGNKFVVVKTIYLTSKKILEAGTVIDMVRHNVRMFQLRLWFRRRRIGTVDTPWADEMLKGVKFPERGSIGKRPDVEDNPTLVGTVSSVGKAKADSVKVINVLDPTIVEDLLASPEGGKAVLNVISGENIELTAEQKAEAKREKRNKRTRELRAAKKAAKGK